MAETTIEWTQRSWNPIVGCSIKSAGCTNCYAMKMAVRVEATGHPVYQGLTARSKSGFVWTGKLALNEAARLDALRRRKPTTWFVNSMGDLFHEDCPDEWIDRVFAVMALCAPRTLPNGKHWPGHTFQVLTKRSDRMRRYLSTHRWHIWAAIGRAIDPVRWRSLRPIMGGDCTPLPNVWLGVSVEDQRAADERVPDLLATPAAVRWLSCEPLLGPVDLTRLPAHTYGENCHHDVLRSVFWHPSWDGPEPIDAPTLDWIAVGGESGKNARPMHPDWARSLRDQCAAAGVPFFFKQWGEWFPYGEIDADGHQNSRTRGEKPGLWHDWKGDRGFSVRIGKKSAGRLLDGVLHDAMPSSPARGGGPAQPVEGHPRHG